MKKLKCDSCGANLKVDEKGEYAYCEYCDLKYKLKDDVNIDINLNMDGDKQVSPEDIAAAKKVRKISLVIFCILFVIFIVIFSIIMIDMVSSSGKPAGFNAEKSEADVRGFNMPIEVFATSESGFFIQGLLDAVVLSNSQNERKVSVVYLDREKTNKREEILNIKDSIDDNIKYSVALEYDKKGFIKTVNIKERK